MTTAVLSPKKVYNGVDLMRFLAAILVVGIHTRPFYEWNYPAGFVFENLITRIAVPFFFLSSGYFLFSKIAKTSDRKIQRSYVIDFLKRISILYLLWSVIYFPYEIYLLNKEYYSVSKSLAVYVFRFFSWGSHYHLWYIPALVMSTLLVYAFFVRDRFYLLFCVCLVLYVIGLMGDSYTGFIKDSVFKEIHQWYIHYFHSSRNLVFFGSVFIALGAFLARHKPKLGKTSLAILLAISVLSFITEVLLLNYFHVNMANMAISLLWVTPVVFLLLVQSELPSLSSYSSWFRVLSIGIYYSHPLFLAIVYRIISYAHLQIDQYVTVAFLSIFALSAVFTIAVRQSKIKFLQLLIS